MFFRVILLMCLPLVALAKFPDAGGINDQQLTSNYGHMQQAPQQVREQRSGITTPNQPAGVTQPNQNLMDQNQRLGVTQPDSQMREAQQMNANQSSDMQLQKPMKE